MIRQTIRVIYIKSQIDIFNWHRQIWILKKSILYIKIYVIRRKTFLVIFSFYKPIEVSNPVRFNAGKIFLVNRRKHRKNIFEFIRESIEFNIHVVAAIIYPLKKTFGMQFQIIEGNVVGIKGISMRFILDLECHFHAGFGGNMVWNGATKT